MLTRIRNAIMARHKVTEIPYSKVIARVADVLKAEGYITDVETVDRMQFKALKVTLKYAPDRSSVVVGLKRHSVPGSRKYASARALPRVRNGLGTAIISTSRGIMTDHEAREANLGGEVLCSVW
jgi:small subunit ribosomal protein S8